MCRIMAILLLCVAFMPEALGQGRFAMLPFTDNSHYELAGAEGVARDLTLANLWEQGLSVAELRESVEGNRLARTVGYSQTAAAAWDFGYFVSCLVEPRLDAAKEGEILVQKLTKAIGEGQGTEFLVHGTVDYIGNYTDGTKLYLYRASIKETGVEVHVTLRVFEVATGKVVYCRQGMGRGKRLKVGNEQINIGSDKYSSVDYLEAMTKAVSNAAKDIGQVL